MKEVQSSYRIVDPVNNDAGIAMLRKIERMARISHKSEEAQAPASWDRFIQAVVMGHGDWSVVEHASATIIFRVPRGVTHELVRHRLFSYTQESTRFVNGRKSYPDGLEFIYPEEMKKLSALCFDDWRKAMEMAEGHYLAMLDTGIRPQEARSVLPNALAATIAVTGNLRSWRHLFIMRTTKETHPDFRVVMIPLLGEMQALIPLLFDDIKPGARQADNLRLPR